MSLFLTLLPLYAFGNLHCIGMCGPLVMMLGRHRYRYFYFLGRTASFTLAGAIAGEVGAVLHLFLQHYYIPALISFLFGGLILMVGFYTLFGWQYPGYQWLAKRLAKTNQTLSLLMLRDRAWPSFLFGFFTLALPCGQTLIVYSAIALVGDPLSGLLNGFAFALLTSPALLMAMNAHRLISYRLKPYYNQIIGACALIVGTLGLCRGLAELNLINHCILNPNASPAFHIVLY